jgi:hypothetical protein
MSEDQENALLGQAVKDYQAAKRRLACLHAEAERLGNYLVAAGDALRLRHNLWLGEHCIPSGELDLTRWPTSDQIQGLVKEIFTAQGEKSRLAEHLKDAGFPQPE